MTRTVSFRLERCDAGGETRRDDGFAFRLHLDPLPRGRWLSIRYAANLYADPVRPVLRVERPGGDEDALMPGPVLGRGHWLGLLPPDASGLRLDPGTDGFRIESVEATSTAALLARCLRQRPERGATALWFLARRNPRRFRDTLRGACATLPLSAWEAYATERRRAPEPGFDRPLAAGEGVAFRLVLDVPAGAEAAARDTLAALAVQGHAGWRVALTGPGAAAVAAEDARVLRLDWPAGVPAARALAPLLDRADAWLGVLGAGDRLAPEALALLADRLARAPGATLIYADEEIEAPDGLAPRLKPGWSPDLASATDYVGRPAFHAGLGAAGAAGSVAALERDLMRAAVADPGARVVHLARVLGRRAAPPAEASRPAPVWALPAVPPRVSVVMPSRDRLDLVARSTSGVLRETTYPDLELVLVDNGSRDPAVLRLYDALRADPRVRMVSWPGPFDFSAMVNDGVAAADGDVVLLLNNDTAVRHPDWLAAMVRHAVRPEVGAVGARLLYGDGTLQHAGVVVGLGGRAGHVLRRRPADAPGHLGRLRTAHEVSAVTAACLAVAKAKYEAVGGLDAQNFPIDFNDVDLCLRLGARGWKTVWTPEATLDHLESISRGPAEGAARVRFEAEAARFAARWGAVIRDDPFYHPALSATTFGEELE